MSVQSISGVSDCKVDVLSRLRRGARASSAARYEGFDGKFYLSSESKAAMLVSKTMVQPL